MNTLAHPEHQLEYIGAGRSAKVFRGRFADGRQYAKKIFTGEGLSRLVLNVLTGADNPYRWCEAAMATAVARRKVLEHLLPFWFDDQLRLPQMYDWGWEPQQQAFFFRVELIKGQHVPLKNWLDPMAADHFAQLQDSVMKPLQSHLINAGLDGIVWQAGLGNPVAANNFMLESLPDGGQRWVWIDLESGVPALFAMNVLKTLSFYLPKSWHHRRPLFDDVDLDKLGCYLSRYEVAIKHQLGGAHLLQLQAAVDELDDAQTRWKSLSRRGRQIASALQYGEITPQQASCYRQNRLRWAAKRVQLTLKSVGSRLLASRTQTNQQHNSEQALSTKRSGVAARILRQLKYSCLQLASPTLRQRYSRQALLSQLSQWQQRGGLTVRQSEVLKSQYGHSSASAWLADYQAHKVLSPLAYGMAVAVLPILMFWELIGGLAAMCLFVAAGGMVRTAYSGYRLVRSEASERPWSALLLSPLPILGQLAFVLQLVRNSQAHSQSSAPLGQFILINRFVTLGRNLPIWGGMDSGTEHWLLERGLRYLDRLSIAR